MKAINSSQTNKSPELKLDWAFSVFDKDLSGSIERGEIDLMVRGLFSMAGIEFDCEDINNCRDEIIRVCDTDGNLSISKREFLRNALGSAFIRSIL